MNKYSVYFRIWLKEYETTAGWDVTLEADSKEIAIANAAIQYIKDGNTDRIIEAQCDETI